MNVWTLKKKKRYCLMKKPDKTNNKRGSSSWSRFWRKQWKKGPSPNQKMSVTNEDVSGAGSITGGGTTPTSQQIAVSTIASPTTTTTTSIADDVVKSGYLRKLKGKKKFFVLRKETDADKPARLEYYANEKKFRMGHPPRKSMVLKACFNISGPESNLKSKYSVSLHTHNDCVRISMSSEEELNDWLRSIKVLAGEEDEEQPVELKPHFEHIWMVHALNKGLGSKENIIGQYRLCLTSKELTLLKVGEHDGRNGQIRFPLNVIRNVSHDATFGCFFHIELGRSASTGPGQLSLKTEDNNIAQNMHLLILKAMQNYSKDDILPPRDRDRRYTWGEQGHMRPSHSTPPSMVGPIVDESGSRIRTDSMQSQSSGGRGIGIPQLSMSPPVPILNSPPSFFVNSPNLYSTGTDSASSSYSMDYDNNNGLGGGGDDRSNDEEDYVPFNPVDDHHRVSPKNMKLPISQQEMNECKESSGSNAQTPSSYMGVQSPTSPFDNYLPMSPAGTGGFIPAHPMTTIKSNDKGSVSHSRNSSLIEDTDGYVPMIPGHHSRSESGAGSTGGSATGLDDAYLDMDFTRKMNLSNDDVRRVSPASSESLQSNTPSSDFPLEKVTSYLTDDFDDAVRPIRAYSVGSRSDTNALGKLRSKNRLEAVQENFRIRAMSVGSKNPRKPPIHSNASTNVSMLQSSQTSTGGVGPLSSSWSGSTGRWPIPKFPNATTGQQSMSSFSQNSDSVDSDLMELDFSKNKKTRKRSHPGPPSGCSLNSTPSSTTSNTQKLSPIPKGVLVPSTMSQGPSVTETSAIASSEHTQSSTSTPQNYVASSPIAIKSQNSVSRPTDPAYTFHEPISSGTQVPLLSRLTGTDLKRLKELDDEGAYLNMDFSKSSTEKAGEQNPTTTSVTSPSSTKFCLNLCSSSSSSRPDPSSSSNKSYATCNGEVHGPGSDHLPSSTLNASTILTRIEESPEKLEHRMSSGSITPQSPGRVAPLAKPEEDHQVTYAAIEHAQPGGRQPAFGVSNNSSGVSSPCGAAASSSTKVTYAQIDFVKSVESVKPNS